MDDTCGWTEFFDEHERRIDTNYRAARSASRTTDLHPSSMLTVKQAAGVIGVSERTIRRWVAAGWLPAWRRGRTIRIRRWDLANLTELRE
jgi:excisionase family DNA binding protein